MYFYASGVELTDDEANALKAIKQAIIIGGRFRTLVSKPSQDEDWLYGVI